jgi:hypothetical protein
LGRRDLGGQLNHAGIDALLAQDDVAHLDAVLLVVGNHVLGECDVGLVVCACHYCPATPPLPLITTLAVIAYLGRDNRLSCWV